MPNSSNLIQEYPELLHATSIPRTSKPKRNVFQKIRVAFGVVGLLTLCMVGVGALSYFVLLPQSLRLDEAQSLWQTNHSLAGTLRVVANDVHVPLYHILLHIWQTFFGNDIAVARLFSLTIFIIAIPFFYMLARNVLSVRWALVATVLFSFSPFMNWYGSEIRMYSLLALFSIISQLSFIRILKYDRGWLIYLAVALLGVYTHYFFFFTLATQVIYYFCNRKQFIGRAFQKFIAIAALVALAFTPWLYYFIQLGAAENTSPLLSNPSSVDFFNAFSQFAFGFQDDYVNTILLSCWPLVVLFGFFAVRKNLRFPPAIIYILMAGVAPVLLAYVISITITPFFLSRYMVSVVAPLTILVVWFISQYPRKFGIAAISVLSIATILSSFQQYISAHTPVKEDYQQVAALTSQQASAQDLVVLSAPFTIYPFSYYYSGQAQIETLPRWDRVEAGAIPTFSASKLPNEVNQLTENHRNIYLVLSQDQGYEDDIAKYFRERFQQLEKREFSPGLTLYVYKVGYNKVPALY